MEPSTFFSSGMWIMPIIMMLILIFGFAFIVRYVIMGNKSDETPCRGKSRSSGFAESAETPLQILQKRYANGKITEEEFKTMKQNLE